MAKKHKVAVYGTLMAGERNKRWAADALDRRPCTLRGTLYDTGRGYPAFVSDADGDDVKAELLTVTGRAPCPDGHFGGLSQPLPQGACQSRA